MPFSFPGKEIILRRYLNDQTPEVNPYIERGFLNMAMMHLNHQQEQPGQVPSQNPHAAHQQMLQQHQQIHYNNQQLHNMSRGRHAGMDGYGYNKFKLLLQKIKSLFFAFLSELDLPGTPLGIPTTRPRLRTDTTPNTEDPITTTSTKVTKQSSTCLRVRCQPSIGASSSTFIAGFCL